MPHRQKFVLGRVCQGNFETGCYAPKMKGCDFWTFFFPLSFGASGFFFGVLLELFVYFQTEFMFFSYRKRNFRLDDDF